VHGGMYRLLSEGGSLDRLYPPGTLQALKGHRFSDDAMEIYHSYRKGQAGVISLASVVNKLSGECHVLLCAE